MKKISVIVLISILFVTAGYYIYTYPKNIDLELEGVKFRYGSEEYKEKVMFKISGVYNKRLFSGDKFIGDITINDESLPNQTLVFNNDYDLLVHFNENKKSYEFWGALYINRDFDRFTISVFESNSWNGKDGLQISAPADTQRDAILISEQLMRR